MSYNPSPRRRGLTEEQTTARKEAAALPRRASARRGSGRRSPKGTRPRASRRGPLTVFVHIPKTAGTTLTGVLRGNFPAGGVRTIGNVFHGAGGVDAGPVVKLRESGPVVTRDIYLLGGHLPFGVHQYLPSDTRYLTFLRDPVERTLSHYYRLLTVRKRNPIPEGMTFEQVLGGGEYLYDNLQTRMLSTTPEPFGEVTEEMLEQAKQNLGTAFVCFGLADRFDESLVLLKRRLGLRSILYVSKRMTANRPRTEESKEDLAPIAERFNAYDIELYRWASEQFEQTIAEQDADFAVEVAALRTAVSGGRAVSEAPPAAAELSRKQLWEELVRARADLLGWEFELSKSNDPSENPQPEQEEDLRALLKQANQGILQLHDRIEGLEDRLEGVSGQSDSEELEPAAEGAGRQRRRERARGAARLEQLHARIEELEEAIGDQPESARDVHVVRELERLRALAAQVEEQAHGSGSQKRPQVDDGGGKAERRQTPQQKAERAAALMQTRDNSAETLDRMERRLAEIRGEIQELEAAAAGGDETPTGEGAESPGPKERLERLRGLASEREKRIELQRKRMADIERRLSALGAEAGSPGDSAALEHELDQAAGSA
jgi:Galactose-3-O-sulfotransferase